MKPKDYPAHLRPQKGEALAPDDPSENPKFAYPFGAHVESLPPKVRGIVATHLRNRNCPIVAGDDGKMPTGVVACVRDRNGLIGYAEDGAGQRIEGTLADVKGSKPRKPRKKKGDEDAAGSPETAPSPEATSAPPPPPQGDEGSPTG